MRGLRLQLTQEADHLQGGQDGVGTLVASFATRTVHGLVNRVTGEYPEADRQGMLKAYAVEPGGTLAANEVEVGRLAANHGSQRSNAVVATQLSERLCCQRQLDDLKKKRFQFYFDNEAASRACKFIELLMAFYGGWFKSTKFSQF